MTGIEALDLWFRTLHQDITDHYHAGVISNNSPSYWRVRCSYCGGAFIWMYENDITFLLPPTDEGPELGPFSTRYGGMREQSLSDPSCFDRAYTTLIEHFCSRKPKSK